MNQPYHAKVILRDGMHFEGYSSDTGGEHFAVQMDADEGAGGHDLGMRPNKLLLISLAGCMAMDVISILRKKKQDVRGFEVSVLSEQAPEHPMVYTEMVVTFLVTGVGVSAAAVERAIALSYDKYCPIANLLKPVVPIRTQYEIVEA